MVHKVTVLNLKMVQETCMKMPTKFILLKSVHNTVGSYNFNIKKVATKSIQINGKTKGSDNDIQCKITAQYIWRSPIDR